jgi:hypothetical protein
LHCYNFIILVPIFSASDFIKKEYFFVPVDLNNGVKIYWAIIYFFKDILVAKSECMEVFIFRARGYQVDLFFTESLKQAKLGN